MAASLIFFSKNTIEDKLSKAKEELLENYKECRDPDKFRFCELIKNFSVEDLFFDRDKKMEGLESYNDLEKFAKTRDFDVLLKASLLLRIVKNEQFTINIELRQDENDINILKNDIAKNKNPFIEKRNWFQRKFEWARFSENKWNKNKLNELSNAQEKFAQKRLYLTKLGDIGIKADSRIMQIGKENKCLFANADKDLQKKNNILSYKNQEFRKETKCNFDSFLPPLKNQSVTKVQQDEPIKTEQPTLQLQQSANPGMVGGNL